MTRKKKRPSPALLNRVLRALESGRLTTKEVAARLRVCGTTALRSCQLLHASGQLKRAVRKHWRRAPEEGWAEWVWRLPGSDDTTPSEENP